MIGKYPGNDARSMIYQGDPGLPFGASRRRTSSRRFSIALPAGKWRLAVARGMEYLPVFDEFQIRAGETLTAK